MGQYHLRRILRPSRIAVAGASEEPGTTGNGIMTNLIAGKFPGEILPVNPEHEKLHNLDCYGRIEEIKTAPDLVIITEPIRCVPDIIKSCIRQKAAGAIIVSSGDGEAGDADQPIVSEIKKIAHKGGVRILGPNSLGIICPAAGINASYASDMPPAGNLAFISQSGAISTAVLDLAFKEHFGFSHFISLGEMLDVDFDDIIDYLGNDGATKSILLYMEHLTQIRKFMSAARSVSRVKPIIVLKAGRCGDTPAAAVSHSGVLAGEDAVYDAAFKRAGIVRVNTIEELFDCAELTAKQPRPVGPGLAVITNGKSPAVMVGDALHRYHHTPVPLPETVVEALDQSLPGAWSRTNPINIREDAPPEVYQTVLDICIREKEIHGVLMVLAPPALSDPTAIARALVSTLKTRHFPVVICLMGGIRIEAAMDLLNRAGIPTYETPERAVKAFVYLQEYAKNRSDLTQIPPKLARNLEFDREKVKELIENTRDGDFMADSDCKAVLGAYGMPVVTSAMAAEAEEAVQKAEEIGYPLAMKLYSPDITHKTEAGGVALDLRSADDVREAFRKITASAAAYRSKARIKGVILQPFINQAEYEVLLGAKQDPNFGPVVLFGAGGIYTEALRDRALGLPPLNRLLAARLIEATNVYKVLKGFRNRPPANLAQLQEMLIRLSQLLIDFPEIAELDMNPVLIRDGRAVLVDCRLRIARTGRDSPHHLVISPYPAEYEKTTESKDGMKMRIRPVRPEDAPMFREFHTILSPTSLYYRFFTPMQEIKPEMLARFTQLDYDREIALVAISETGGTEQMLGVARIMGDPDVENGEFAVLVGDPWQGKGIGARLLKDCLDIARDRHFKVITGFVLSENRGMINLGKKMGFTVHMEDGEVELTMTF